MVKEYNGVLWYCCPKCGKRLFMVSPDAECRGLLVKCQKGAMPDGSRCGWVGEIIIKKEA